MNRTFKHFSTCILSIIIVLAFTFCPKKSQASQLPGEDVVFQYVDPLIKIFRSSTIFPKAKARVDVARGTRATFQFAIRSNRQLRNLKVSVSTLQSKSAKLDRAKVEFIAYVQAGHTARVSSHDRLHPMSSYYPDPILDKPPDTLRWGLTQPVWIKVPVPVDTKPGIYRGKVSLTAMAGERPIYITRSITVHVYPPVIKKTRLWVSNWWYGIGANNNRLRQMNGGKYVEPYSQRYWQLLKIIAQTMASYRQNTVYVSPLRLTQFSLKNGHYKFDFSHFDHTIELFINNGVIGRIEGGHIGHRASKGFDPESEFLVYMPEIKADTTVLKKKSIITSERARSFYHQFIPALVKHLKKKGWFDIYMQHIADEPTKKNAFSYLAIVKFIKKIEPDLRLIDAIQTKSLKGVLDIWVPTLKVLDENQKYFKKRRKAGDELWFYTCVVPQGEYANRFVELPLIKTRILHWINFRYNAVGYLHWGFNSWDNAPFERASRNLNPGGDPWIVYPKKGGLIPSIRLEAMRDGVEDYELLKMLEAVHPKHAHKLAKKIVADYDKYETYVPAFRKTRRHLLEVLSKALKEDQNEKK